MTRLRRALKQAQDELAAAKGELGQRQIEVRRLERRIRLRLGSLIDELASLEEELEHYNLEIARRRSPMDPNAGYLPVEEQYRRTWETPVTEPSEPIKPASSFQHFNHTDEKQLKKLYRQLARQYHPDLARDNLDREYRTEKMAALNEAYAARSLVEMAVLAKDQETRLDQAGSQTTAQLAAALEQELAAARRQIFFIQNELANLHNSPVVQLSLQVKLDQHDGRDLLAEMAANLRQTIARKRADRDLLKSQFDRLGA